ncbi:MULTISPECIES: DUF1491 family protein [Ochrobactrum]|uniref:DUF1491 family protein n=1 Tax=Ochrobactrum chromiisoli TaxID=2993941 RepID=A0ABT3QK61_9HYPH|nr:DUF1491 family protein [Ochrobactrum chromiisoli]MCX2695979.1 DUF1491 family protein [Ochrobactrum chromiisoli]
MRVTSDFWVSALIRRVQGEGGFAYLARRGSKEAGAIFIKVSSRLGTCDLYSPAPQTSYDEDDDGERMFLRILHEVDALKAGERMEREIRFDPDLWLVELEDLADPANLFSISPDDL